MAADLSRVRQVVADLAGRCQAGEGAIDAACRVLEHTLQMLAPRQRPDPLPYDTAHHDVAEINIRNRLVRSESYLPALGIAPPNLASVPRRKPLQRTPLAVAGACTRMFELVTGQPPTGGSNPWRWFVKDIFAACGIEADAVHYGRQAISLLTDHVRIK